MENITQRKTTIFYILAIIFALAFLSGVSYSFAQETDSTTIKERDVSIYKIEIDAARSLLREKLETQRLDVKSDLEIQKTNLRSTIDTRRVEIRTTLKSGDGENREEIRVELEEMRNESRTMFKQHRTDRTQLLEDSRVERKKILEESRLEQRELITERRKGLARERAHAYTERIINKFIAAIERLEKLAERMQSRIDALTEQGLDLSEAQEKLYVALDEIANTYNAIDDIEAAIVVILESDNPSEGLSDIRHQVSVGKGVLKSAHRLLVDAITAIKATGGVGDGDDSDVSDDTSDDTDDTGTSTTQ